MIVTTDVDTYKRENTFMSIFIPYAYDFSRRQEKKHLKVI